LAKIDNKQFDNTETISFDHLLDQSIAILEEHFEQKNISVQESISKDVKVNGTVFCVKF
jgi:signal transduction histidine kinase